MSNLTASTEILERLKKEEADSENCLNEVRGKVDEQTLDFRQLSELRRDIGRRIPELESEIRELSRQEGSQASKDHADRVKKLVARQSWTGKTRIRLGLAMLLWLVLAGLLYIVLALPFSGESSDNNALVSGGKLRDYLSRVAGTVPQVCVSEDERQATDDGTVSTADNWGSDWSAGGTPLFVQFWVPKEFHTSTGETCTWREKLDAAPATDYAWAHFLAAVSPDVGSIQKLSLLFVILAGLELYRIARERALADVIMDDPTYPNGLTIALDGDWTPFTLFPRRYLTLASQSKVHDPYSVITDQIQKLARELKRLHEHNGSMTTRALDYVGDLYMAGQSLETVDALVERADQLENTYRSHLLDRFWRIDYFVWLLPTVGFLGTIYGISLSLVRAKGIFELATADGENGSAANDFGRVVDSLGTAFDTTAFALLLLAFLIWFQRKQEAATRDFGEESSRSVRKRLLTRLRSRSTRSDSELVDETIPLVVTLTPASPELDHEVG